MLSVNEINLLEAQNKGLKKQNAELQNNVEYWRNLYQEMQMKLNRLEEDYKDLLAESSELLKERDELKAENAKLKQAKDKYYQHTLDDEIKLNELYQCLQEIKEILLEQIRWQGQIPQYDLQILQKIAECEVSNEK